MHSHRFKSAILIAGLLALTACHKAAPRPTTAPVEAEPQVDPYLTARSSYDSGDKEKAAADLTAAIQHKPDAIMPRQLLAQIYLDKNDYAAAAEQYDKLTKLDPYTQSNFYELGYCRQLLNQLPEAVAAYKQSLVLDSKDAKATVNLGVVYLSMNQIDDAVNYLEQATKLDDKSWYAWDNYGIALDAHGQPHEGEAAFRRSLELDSTQAATIYNLGSNLMSQGRAGEAVPVFQELVKRDNSARNHRKLAQALFANNAPYDAIAEDRQVLQLDPKSYQTMNALAWLLITQYEKEAEFDDNKKAEALKLWQQSLAISPDQPDVKAQLAKWGGK